MIEPSLPYSQIKSIKLNILQLKQIFSRRHFGMQFFNECIRVLINIWLKFDHTGLVDNLSPLVQVMAWRQIAIT